MRRTGPVMTNSTVRRASAAALGVVLALGGTALAAPASAAPPEKIAVIVQLVPGSYAAAESRMASSNGGGSVSHTYSNVFHGFAGEFTAQALAALERSPRVARIVADGVTDTVGSGVQTSPTPPWGVDRIDEDVPRLDRSYTYPEDGSGVTAYVIDTGIAPHTQFGNRLAAGETFIRDRRGTTDCNGHGTHVAGTIGGTTYGVAKAVSLVPVRVLDCRGSGSWSGVIAGIDWVAGHHAAGDPAVANMSLGGPVNPLVDEAVVRLLEDGVTVVVAAGNDGVDAANYSPAHVPQALTVGATDNRDARASFSNTGAVVDIFAPGVNITSTWLKGGTKTISGTSMAAPHVAGAAAVVLSQNRGLLPVAVGDELVSAATKGLVGNEGAGSPDRLLRVAVLGTAGYAVP